MAQILCSLLDAYYLTCLLIQSKFPNRIMHSIPLATVAMHIHRLQLHCPHAANPTALSIPTCHPLLSYEQTTLVIISLLPLIKARRTDFWLLQGEQLTRAGKDDVERGGMHSSNKAVRARTERN
jgi:hypothetical protein